MIYLQKNPLVTLQNLAFANGKTVDVANTTVTTTGGAALYRLGGAFTIINCDFYGNKVFHSPLVSYSLIASLFFLFVN